MTLTSQLIPSYIPSPFLATQAWMEYYLVLIAPIFNYFKSLIILILLLKAGELELDLACWLVLIEEPQLIIFTIICFIIKSRLILPS